MVYQCEPVKTQSWPEFAHRAPNITDHTWGHLHARAPDSSLTLRPPNTAEAMTAKIMSDHSEMLLSSMIMIVILIASHTLSSREGDRSARLQGLDRPRGGSVLETLLCQHRRHFLQTAEKMN